MVAISQDDLTADDFRAYLTYEADSGRLIWHKRPPHSHVIVGQEAGILHKDGYRCFKFRGRLRLTHRVVWLMWYGEWPPVLLDHRSRVRDDNRIGNLRLGSFALNSENTTSRKGSSSEYLGVCWNAKSQMWQAGIKQGGRQRHLGLFICERDAAQAAAAARAAIGAGYG